MVNPSDLIPIQESIEEAVKLVIPLPITVRSSFQVSDPVPLEAINIMLGCTGNFRGQVFIESSVEFFKQIGATLFGMEMEGEMLHSFIGEMGNMIMGNFCSQLCDRKIPVDITPPTVIEGVSRIYGFSNSTIIPMQVGDLGELRFVFIIKEIIKTE
ncbi:MAG TPA: chemotaxis protein CheX [Bacillota bacterium]|nr:chemotaxis protein CheX [Bacillota bacterium]